MRYDSFAHPIYLEIDNFDPKMAIFEPTNIPLPASLSLSSPIRNIIWLQEACNNGLIRPSTEMNSWDALAEWFGLHSPTIQGLNHTVSVSTPGYWGGGL